MNKNLFLFAAAAALTFTACSDNDDMTASRDGSLSSNETTAVQFSTYLAGTQTRAGQTGSIVNTPVSDANSLGTLGFGVMAFSTGTTDWSNGQETTIPNFMYNQKVNSTNGTNWTYEPIKYWPNDFSSSDVDAGLGVEGEENNATGPSTTTGGKVSFFAYAPYQELVENGYTTAVTAFTNDNAPSFTVSGTKSTYSTDDKYAFVSGATSLTTDNGIIALTTNETKNDPLVRYGLTSAKYSGNVDLLWGLSSKTSYNLADGNKQTLAANAYNVNLTKQAVNEKIGFLFKHALAKLGGNTDNNTGTTTTTANNSKVKVILDIDNGGTDASTAITGGSKDATTLVTVKSIKISDWKTYKTDKGLTEDKYNGNDVTVNKVRKYGWFDIARGQWSDKVDADLVDLGTDGLGTYSIEIGSTDEANNGKYKLNEAIAEPTSAPTYTSGAWSPVGVLSTKATEAYATPTTDKEGVDEGIVMIPGGEDLQLVVTCDYIVRTYDDHLATTGSGEGTWTKTEQVITNLVTIPTEGIASNKVYSLLIHLGLTSVKFEAQVSGWENPDDPDPTNPDDDPDNSSTTGNKSIYLPSNTLSAISVTSTSDDVEASNGTATVNLTGLSDKATVEFVSAKDASNTDVDNVTVSLGSITNGAATATINVPNNTTGAARTITVVFKVKNNQGQDLQNVTVTINQKANE